MNEFGRIREVKEVNETKNANEKVQTKVLKPDIDFIMSTSLESLIAQNEEAAHRRNNERKL